MIDQFITALNQELDLSAKEIADILWLALQMEESQRESASSNFPPINQDEREREKKEEKLVEEPSPEPQSHTADSISNSEETPTNQVSEEQKAGIYPRNQSSSLDLAFKAPNAPSLQQPLTLARALKPLMRRVPASTNLVLDEAATSEKIARERLWLPVLKPTLEPWLDLELVVDGSISMVIWRQTVRDLERLLKNYGIFRDVRVWVLMEDDREGVQIRRGMGARAKNQPSRSAKELINTSGRSLVLIGSDCVSSLWRDGKVTKTLELWANHVPTAIIQMLPKWLWKRTALGRTSEVRLRALTTGVCNRNLILQQLSLWEELEPEEVVKVPVFTLEEDRVATWAQMLSGNSSIWTAGVGFKLDNPVQEGKGLFNGNSSEVSAEQRVQAFRVTASPMARKLAGLLAAAPVISLPVVRLIRETLLPDSLQVNVAEVFLGGLLKPLAEIGLDTNPDEILYEFIDGVRDLLIDSVPTNYVLNVVDEVSKYVAKKVGLSLEDFAAVLRCEKEIEDSSIVEKIDYFATITAQVLRNLGGDYAKLAGELEVNLVDTVPVNNIINEFEQNRHFIGQEDNNKIYSFCTDKPWNLPFDVLVIPMGYHIFTESQLFPGGGFSRGFQSFLGANLDLFEQSIGQALGENKNKQIQVTPSQSLLVALPAEINQQLSLLNSSLINRFVIIATVEGPDPSRSNAGEAMNSIIALATKQGLTRLVLPLLGTGDLRLPVEPIANKILLSITESLKNLSSNSIEEIIFVDKRESTIQTINQVGLSLFAERDKNKVELPTEKVLDYTRLSNLLAEYKWKEADRETARLMLEACDREERGWLTEKDMAIISSTNLETIDRLWLQYSNGKFGFSVQKQIWLLVGGQLGSDNEEVYKKFGENVGWYIKDKDEWLFWSEHIFNLDAPQGHLPRSLPSQGKRIRPYLFSRKDLKVDRDNIVLPQEEALESNKNNQYFKTLFMFTTKFFKWLFND